MRVPLEPEISDISPVAGISLGGFGVRNLSPSGVSPALAQLSGELPEGPSKLGAWWRKEIGATRGAYGVTPELTRSNVEAIRERQSEALKGSGIHQMGLLATGLQTEQGRKDIPREVFTMGNIPTKTYNEDEIRAQYRVLAAEGISPEDEARVRASAEEAYSTALATGITEADKQDLAVKAGAMYDTEVAKLSPGYAMTMSRPDFIAKSVADAKFSLSETRDQFVDRSVKEAKEAPIISEDEYVDAVLSEQPTTGELGKEFAWSFAPGEYLRPSRVQAITAKGGWTAAGTFAGLAALDAASLIPLAGWGARSATTSAKVAAGASKMARFGTGVRSAGWLGKETLKMPYTLTKAAVTRPVSTAESLVDIVWQPIRHPMQTARQWGEIVTGKVQLGRSGLYGQAMPITMAGQTFTGPQMVFGMPVAGPGDTPGRLFGMPVGAARPTASQGAGFYNYWAAGSRPTVTRTPLLEPAKPRLTGARPGEPVRPVEPTKPTQSEIDILEMELGSAKDIRSRTKSPARQAELDRMIQTQERQIQERRTALAEPEVIPDFDIPIRPGVRMPGTGGQVVPVTPVAPAPIPTTSLPAPSTRAPFQISTGNWPSAGADIMPGQRVSVFTPTITSPGLQGGMVSIPDTGVELVSAVSPGYAPGVQPRVGTTTVTYPEPSVRPRVWDVPATVPFPNPLTSPLTRTIPRQAPLTEPMPYPYPVPTPTYTGTPYPEPPRYPTVPKVPVRQPVVTPPPVWKPNLPGVPGTGSGVPRRGLMGTPVESKYWVLPELIAVIQDPLSGKDIRLSVSSKKKRSYGKRKTKNYLGVRGFV